jgi:hypothetical protein
VSRTHKDQGPRPHQRGGRWPAERPFDYVPSGVPVTLPVAGEWDGLADAMLEHRPAPRLVGATRAEENQTHVRRLLAVKQPAFAAALELALLMTETVTAGGVAGR